MKLQLATNSRGQIAFTLSELMVSSSILLLVIAGVLSAHLFGQRMFSLTQAKLSASDDSRVAISRLVGEIRSAKSLKVGSGNLAAFTEVALSNLQQGSALQVYLSTNTNAFVRYYWDSTDQKLKRTTNGATSGEIIAHSLTNSLVFTSEDFNGTILTNNQNNRVIGITMQFYQMQYPVIHIGPGYYYDFYQLRAKITRRALE